MIKIVPDSVGGKRCLIVYNDDKPVLTIWESAIKSNRELLKRLITLGPNRSVEEELMDLIRTTIAMGASYSQLEAAIQTYLGKTLTIRRCSCCRSTQ